MDDKNPGPKDHQHRGRKFRGKRLKTSIPRPVAAESPPPPPKAAERIAKVMARVGLASRREAEAWIAAGRVSVNGVKISSPALNVTAQDRISVDGGALPQKERTRLFLFHKPVGLVTTTADTHGRPTIFGGLPDNLPRLVSVGRLDLNTEGLILLTNDGGLARALELPATGWLRRYRVRAYGKITQPQLDALRGGIEVDGVQYGAIEATFEREQGSNVWLTFAMREGKNREIRNVMRALGLQVNRLIRVSYGPFQLADLPSGAVEEVNTRTLREQLGERLAALSGADFSGPIVERETRAAPAPRKLSDQRDHASTRRPEARGAERRASKGDSPDRAGGKTGRSSFEGRLRRPPQDDGDGKRRVDGAGQSRPDNSGEKKPHRRRDDDRKPPREERKTPPRHRAQSHRGRHASGPRPSRPKVR